MRCREVGVPLAWLAESHVWRGTASDRRGMLERFELEYEQDVVHLCRHGQQLRFR